MPASQHTVHVAGLQLHCNVSGRAGAPWLVFSNSLMTDLTLWDAQARAFSDRYQILRYDQRGHGRSDVPSRPSTFDELTDDLEALLEWFQIDRAVVIGVSMGGVTALRLAQRQSPRLGGVVACDCQWFSPVTSIAVWDERIRAARHAGMQAMVDPTVNRWFRPAFVSRNGPALNAVRQMIASTPVDGFVACAHALQSFDIRPEFTRNVVPTRFVVGDGDGVLPTVMRDMHRALPGSGFVQIAEAGHLPNVEQAATVNGALEEFFNQIQERHAAPRLPHD